MINKLKLIFKNLRYLYRFNIKELVENMELYICHTTKGKMSKVYKLETMLQVFDETEQESFDKIIKEMRDSYGE